MRVNKDMNGFAHFYYLNEKSDIYDVTCEKLDQMAKHHGLTNYIQWTLGHNGDRWPRIYSWSNNGEKFSTGLDDPRCFDQYEDFLKEMKHNHQRQKKAIRRRGH